MHNKNLNYRADVDGLRAIAVMLVVLNHVGIGFFSGGYIGVDVFFVISGYLITGIISKQMEDKKFSFFDFYARRARRILPALYVLLLAVMAAGYIFLLPSDYSVLSQSTLGAVAFASNIFFWKNSGGYFSSSAEEMPLLHIWSLSVEEQFYFAWPLLLILLIKLKSKAVRLAVVSATIFASFAIAEIGLANAWSSTYFLLPSRAGELLIGAALALWLSRRTPSDQNGVVPQIAAVLGLLMVALPSVMLSKTSQFPGLNALIPCVGAALIIGSRTFGATLVGILLSSRPFVFVGLISYSTYLWHWPITSFIIYARIDITPHIAAAIVISSLLLGYLSWRYVENTFRHQQGATSKSVATAALAGTILVVSSPLFVYVTDGIPSRFPYALLTQDQLTAERSRYWNGISTKETTFTKDRNFRNIVVVGNSHAYDFSYALTENGFNGKIKLIETSFYCFNFSNNYVWPQKKDECATEKSKVLSTPELRQADEIYLHDNWGGKNLEGLEQMISEIRRLNPAPITVVGPKMTYTETALTISKMAQQNRHITPASINEFSKKFEHADRFELDAELRSFFDQKNFKDLRYISSLDAQCGKDRDCKIISDDGQYLYFDSDHFTLLGSRYFGERLRSSGEVFF